MIQRSRKIKAGPLVQIFRFSAFPLFHFSVFRFSVFRFLPYPFTAPAVRPAMNSRCRAKNSTTTGRTDSSVPAINAP